MLPTSEIEKIRAMFPVTGKVNYLNHAAVSPIPTAAVDSINAYLEDVRDYGMMHETRWLGEIERIRGRVQAFINAGEGEIAFIKSPLVAMQIVAQGLNMREGEKIIVADAEFPANVYPWISMVPKGVEVNFVGAQGGMINPEDIERAIDSRTRLVATSMVEFASGCRNDVEGIAAVCKRKCVNYFVDVTQAAGEMNVDVKAIGADFALIGGYKWLFGPQGVFMFFCRSDIEKRIRYDGVSWCKITHPEEIAYRAGHENDARRFESDQPNFMGIMGLGGSLDLREKVGSPAINAHIKLLADRLLHALINRGYDMITPAFLDDRSGIVVFTHPQRDMREIHQNLKRQGIITSLRNRTIRVSPHFYNTNEELDRLVEALP